MVADTIPFPAAPSIDTPEARWAAGELAGLIRRVSPDSVAGMILRQAQRELESLVRSGAADAPATVAGPFRVRVVA